MVSPSRASGSILRLASRSAMAGLTKIRESTDFQQVALPHLDHIYTAALYLTRDQDVAADVTQETFLRAFRYFHRFEPGTNCRAWLLTILHNVFRNHYRRRRREGPSIDVEESQGAAEARAAVEITDDPESLVLSDLLDDEIRAALESLPEEFRHSVVLVDLQELTYAEAARAADCPVGTIRSRLSRGRKLLAERLREYAARNGHLRRSGVK
jgi:RNA polymerase sigma-70 factor, ECF subfamily